jgi:hypothetical protein
VALDYHIGANSIEVYPRQGTFAYLERSFWVVRMGTIEVTVWRYGVRVREHSMPVGVHDRGD